MIYLDNAATTKTAPEVVEAMLPYFTEFYGNASTVYDFAANSKAAIAKARQQIADVIGAKKEDTSNAVQIFGGYGYSKEYPVEKLMRDVKVFQIFEGANQVQRLTIANVLNKEYK